MKQSGANYRVSTIGDIQARGSPLLHGRVGYVVEDAQNENQPKMYIVL